MKRLLLACILLTSCGGSATNPSTPNPPAVSTPASIDKKIATGLSDAAAIIQGLEPLVVQYPGLKAPLNQAIGIYTTAKAAGLVYHTAVISGGNPDPAQIQAEIQQVLTSLTGLQALYKKP